MNEKSSRSHAILSITLKQEKWVPASSRSSSPTPAKLGARGQKGGGSARLEGHSQPQASGEDGDWIITTSKCHFVDLAGSERVSENT